VMDKDTALFVLSLVVCLFLLAMMIVVSYL
jgi:hypothetical protein